MGTNINETRLATPEEVPPELGISTWGFIILFYF